MYQDVCIPMVHYVRHLVGQRLRVVDVSRRFFFFGDCTSACNIMVLEYVPHQSHEAAFTRSLAVLCVFVLFWGRSCRLIPPVRC